eukprot:symbB.v1.2.014322.t1/scaffold1020.1/size145545/10
MPGRLFWKSTNFEAFIGRFKNGLPREGLFINEKGFCVARAEVSADGVVRLSGVQPDEEISVLNDTPPAEPLVRLEDFLETSKGYQAGRVFTRKWRRGKVGEICGRTAEAPRKGRLRQKRSYRTSLQRGTMLGRSPKSPKSSGFKSKGMLTMLFLTLSVFAVFEFRVNALLMIYMLFVNGHWEVLKVDTLLPLLDKYLDFELWLNPKNFVGYEVPELQAEDFSWDEFMRVSKNRRLVTVVRGLMNNTRASKEFCSKDWIKAHGDFSLVEILPKKDDYKYDYTYNMVNFSQYIQDIQSGNRRYSNGLDEMLLRYPDLVESMELKRLQNPNGCRAVAMFVNGKGEGLQWHNANHFNMVMEYHGKKIWQLLDSKYSLFTAPGMAMDPYATGFNANSPKSMFDKLPTFEVELNPGDVLFNPVWSWHRVRNEADRNTNLVAMGSCRFSEWDKALTTAPALELGRSWGHPMWVSSKLPSWVMWIPFFRVLQDGIGIAYDLFPMWGQAGYEVDCFSSKKRACDHHYEVLGVKFNP